MAAKKKKQIVVERGKRKAAIARAVIRPGTGRITVNKVSLETISNPVIREIIAEPLAFVERKLYDVDVAVRGGGVMGQAQAARTAIARAVVEETGDEDIKQRMIGLDKSFLVEDPRRVEPKKFKGPKARARFTKSYR